MFCSFCYYNAVWNDRSFSLRSKIRLMHSLVTSVFLYAFESWTLTAELQRRIQAMEMRCYHKILFISYEDYITNKEDCAKIQQAIGPHKDLLTVIKRCKLQWYGHVSRSSCLAKTILQGTVKGERRRGRQKKRWEDNIREWTGLEFTKSQSAVENREKWRKLVVKSSLVPQQLLQLRDRWRGEAYIICVFSMLPAKKPSLSKTGHGISTVHNNLRYEETSSRFPQEKW